MQIEIIRTSEQFDHLRPEWEAVYAADPQANVFVSWAWLRGWIEAARPDWLALVARSTANAAPCAFAFLRQRTHSESRLNTRRELYLGGKPHADYGGFLCAPEAEARALPALATALQSKIEWDQLHLQDLIDARLARLTAEFGTGFVVAPATEVACPYITLPATWEAYLESGLSAKVRKMLRYYTKKAEALPGFRATVAEAATLEAHLEALMRFWQARWNHNPAGQRTLLRECFAQGCLWLGGLWQAETPIALLAAFPDHIHRTFNYYMLGHNPEFGELSPGKVMVGYAIRSAIEQGFGVFDFLRGSEEYKLSLGAVERPAHSLTIQRTPSGVRRLLAQLESTKPRAAGRLL